MMKSKVALGVMMALALAGSAMAEPLASDAEVRACPGFEAYGVAQLSKALDGIKDAIVNKDAKTLVGTTAPYLRIGGKKVTAKALSANFDSILPPAFQKAVMESSILDLECVGSRGMMLKNGILWLNAVCADQTCGTTRIEVIGVNP
jgi:hypothetical protein